MPCSLPQIGVWGLSDINFCHFCHEKNAQVLNIFRIMQLGMIPISPERKTKWQCNKVQFACSLNTIWYHHLANHFLHFGFNLSITKITSNIQIKTSGCLLENWLSQKSKNDFSKTSRKSYSPNISSKIISANILSNYIEAEVKRRRATC